MSIRDIINQRQIECRNSEQLFPERASQILVELSAILGNINSEILEREIAYNKRLLSCYEKESKANRAKILAETSEEYIALREAKNAEVCAVEMIRSLKYFLKVREEELRQSKYL